MWSDSWECPACAYLLAESCAQHYASFEDGFYVSTIPKWNKALYMELKRKNIAPYCHILMEGYSLLLTTKPYNGGRHLSNDALRDFLLTQLQPIKLNGRKRIAHSQGLTPPPKEPSGWHRMAIKDKEPQEVVKELLDIGMSLQYESMNQRFFLVAMTEEVQARFQDWQTKPEVGF